MSAKFLILVSLIVACALLTTCDAQYYGYGNYYGWPSSYYGNYYGAYGYGYPSYSYYGYYGKRSAGFGSQGNEQQQQQAQPIHQ